MTEIINTKASSRPWDTSRVPRRRTRRRWSGPSLQTLARFRRSRAGLAPGASTSLVSFPNYPITTQMLTDIPPLSRLPALEPPNVGFAATDGGEDDVWANRDGGGGAPAESGLGFLGTFHFISAVWAIS